MDLPAAEIRKLRRQVTWGLLFFPLVGYSIAFLLRFVMRYKVRNRTDLRRKFREQIEGKEPVLICPNHLTLIDSVLLHWALGSIWWYLFHWNKLAWNFPAAENFKQTYIRRLITYLSKCIPVYRRGSKEHHALLISQMVYLLQQGELLNVFPEGTRSRTGKIEVDSVAYGVGQVASRVRNLKVLCVYMRGEKQDSYSDYPQANQYFQIDIEPLYLHTAGVGEMTDERRLHRDLARQIIEKLAEMERRHFK